MALALALLTCAALALRLTGLSFSLPHSWEPDGLVFVRQVEHLERATPDPERDPFYGYYPHLISRLVTLTPQPAAAQAETLDDHLRAASSDRLRIRRVIAVLSALIVPGTWILARMFLPRGPALFAAALAAFSMLQIWFAQQSRPHAASAVFALFAVVGAVWLRRRATFDTYVVAFLLAILATCSLQSGFAVLIPLCAAHVLRERGGTRHAHLFFVLGLAALAVCVWIYYPFLFATSQGRDAAALDIQGENMNLSGHKVVLSAFNGGGFPIVLGALWNYEPILTLLLGAAAIALAMRLRERRQGGTRVLPHPPAGWRERVAGQADLLVVLSYVVPYTLVIGMYEHTYQRFVIPLLPFAATFAAYGLFALGERLGGNRERLTSLRSAAGLLAVALAGAQAFAAVRLVTIRCAEDTSQRAARWIEAHLDPRRDRLVHSASIDLPLCRTRAALLDAPQTFESLFPWVLYQRQIAADRLPEPTWDLRPLRMSTPEARERIVRDPLDYLRSTGAQYAVIEVFDDAVRQFAAPIHLALVQGAQRVARFSPMAVEPGDDRPMAYQDDYFDTRAVWWWRAITGRSMGPVIEIYRLGP
ncbi:MAG: hypothetical protein NTY35_13790 [Planctomycetota bacterium]|nr:hypothetical protein [Planctomycetota bacterium]